MRRLVISLLMVLLSLALLVMPSTAQTNNVVYLPLVVNGNVTGEPPVPTPTMAPTSTPIATVAPTSIPTPTTPPITAPYIGEWVYILQAPGNVIRVGYEFMPSGSFRYSFVGNTNSPSLCRIWESIGSYTANERTITMDEQSSRVRDCDGDWSPITPSDETIEWRATSNPDELYLITKVLSSGALFTRVTR